MEASLPLGFRRCQIRRQATAAVHSGSYAESVASLLCVGRVAGFPRGVGTNRHSSFLDVAVKCACWLHLWNAALEGTRLKGSTRSRSSWCARHHEPTLGRVS